MTRRDIREQIFQILFRVEFIDRELLEKQVEHYFETFTGTDEERDYISTKIWKVVDALPEIDAKLNETSKGWPTHRMGKVELCVLRLGYYEMKYEEAIPESVAINEAVELEKKFGTDDGPAFVNAVLAKLV